MKEIQGKFYDKFNTMEDEIRYRDDIIGQLQNRIHELENNGNAIIGTTTTTTTTATTLNLRNPFRDDDNNRPGSSSGTGSSNELPFMVSFVMLSTAKSASSLAILLQSKP